MSSNRLPDFPLPDARTLRRLGARLILQSDAEFPAGLRELADPPSFLAVLGRLPRSGLAIIGSRRPPQEAADFAFVFAQRVAQPIISGLAAGIDTSAHRGALAAGNPTLAYLGNGIANVYPPENRPLAEQIVASGGGVASAEMPDDAVSDRALLRRDGFQAAHARAVVLICSETDGGAMQTMRFAKQLRRPIFALAAKDGTEYFGNRDALASGAVTLPWNIEDALRTLHDRTRDQNDASSI